MADSHLLGNRGEEDASKHLIQTGHQILSRNFRYGHAEIDIVAEDDTHLIMVEVKARSHGQMDHPEELIGSAKQKHLIRAANHFVELHPTTKEVRFDAIYISYKPQFQLRHIKEAFYPT